MCVCVCVCGNVRIAWRVLVNAVMNLRILYSAGKFFD